MSKEKYNIIKSLDNVCEKLKGERILSTMGHGDLYGANSIARLTMNIKHQTQRLTLNRPEMALLFEGKENVAIEESSFYHIAKEDYIVHDIVKKYDGMTNGRVFNALYFLYSKSSNSYIVIERKEVEDLTEDFGFTYKNDTLDVLEKNNYIPKDTMLYCTNSYSEDMNAQLGVNGYIAYVNDPYLQDDAAEVSQSFADKLEYTSVITRNILLSEDSILLNLYGDNKTYKPLPDIGESIGKTGHEGIVLAIRKMKENRMFSDFRDSSLNKVNMSSDTVIYGQGQIVDIKVYNNRVNQTPNVTTKQILRYWNDAKIFYTKVYKICKNIFKTGAKVHPDINKWMKEAQKYLDDSSLWAYKDTPFPNIMLEITIAITRKCTVGQKIVGRHGNKCVISRIIPDDEMLYMTTEKWTDEHGRVHPKGKKIVVDMKMNPLAIVNRVIAMAAIEPSLTFLADRLRRYIKENKIPRKQGIKRIFRLLEILNKDFHDDLYYNIYQTLTEKQKDAFYKSCIEDGIYLRYDAFKQENFDVDQISIVYDEFPEIKPYSVFIPKPNWGRDVYTGDFHIGKQFTLVLKQSGEKNFMVRSSGAISDEGLPEKSNEAKQGKSWRSETSVKFGELTGSPKIMLIAGTSC